LRVLVAFEDDYRAYREVIAAGIRVLRPRAEVRITNSNAIQEEVKRFEPNVVICDRPEVADPNNVLGRIELSLDPLLPSKIRVGDRLWELTNPALDVLLGVLDEVEELIQTNRPHNKR
jgi:hypothetical protein